MNIFKTIRRCAVGAWWLLTCLAGYLWVQTDKETPSALMIQSAWLLLSLLLLTYYHLKHIDKSKRQITIPVHLNLEELE